MTFDGMRSGSRIGALAVALAAVGGFAGAVAQEHGGQGMSQESSGMQMGGMHMMGGMPMMHMGMRRMMCHMGEHVEGKLAYIKTELKITDAQAAQWNAFADAFRARAQKMSQHCGMKDGRGEHGEHGEQAERTLPQRLDAMEQHLSAHLEALRAMKGPVQALYGVLSDEQKKTADHILHGPMGMM